ncbi:carbohydrate ABC transporter permease [Paenibacillus hexagrammi]|uniref:Carbohydrate ABC transporter permease n=1 Tax=Paenibacillus hexagrammi TaxID=2908839 RepID=A0ABY3SI51_9BACL|nr:carbohydrate ABC transporter permease [Paenibacillus sp. YPD9-1]UJF32637.1 carbohydrate ABC transporter permease [Paenibacillus sp. YPD9-1]
MSKLRFVGERTLTLYVPLCVCTLFILFPIYWTLSTSLKRETDIYTAPFKLLPSPATFSNFAFAWESVGFSTFFKNSIIVASATVVCVLVISLLSGYALSRFSFKGKAAFMILLLCTQFIPAAMLIIPLFLIFKSMSLISSPLSLVITYTTIQLPFNTILMSGFIANVPIQLEEAAMIDGCSRFKSILYVVLPVLMPGIIAVGAFTFIGAWNEFLFALMFISNNAHFTIPVGLSFMQGEYKINYGASAAGSMIALLPTVLLFSYVQKYLVQGMSAGAVKG